jgi:hypothetical protein
MGSLFFSCSTDLKFAFVCNIFLLRQVNKSHGVAELKLDISSYDYISLSRLVPARDTEFAQDVVFGYQSSNLREAGSRIKVGGRRFFL